MLFFPTLILALAPGLLFQNPAIPQEAMDGSVASLVAAELAFAKQADAENTRAAFLAVLDEGGIIFRPGPVNGRDWLTPRTADASKLTWYPSFAGVSRSVDLGYSTGPYEWRAGGGSKEVAHGHFVSVWGRQGGTWKLLLDTGVSHAAPPAKFPLFKPLPPINKLESAPARAVSTDALAEQEQKFLRAAAQHGLADAYHRFAAADLRFYRENSFPLTTSLDILHALESCKGSGTWTCVESRISESGDLGCNYGIAEWTGIGPAAKPVLHRRSVFLHLWKRAHVGGWKLVLDIESPLPPREAPVLIHNRSFMEIPCAQSL